MTLRTMLQFALGCSLALFAACDGDDSANSTTTGGSSTEQAVEDMNQRAQEVAQQAREAWSQFMTELNARLAGWEPEIEQIKSFAREKADVQLDQIVAELDEKTAAARAKLADVGDNLADTTEEERADLNRLMEEAAAALQRAKQRLQELGGQVTQPPSLSGGGGGGGTGAPIDD